MIPSLRRLGPVAVAAAALVVTAVASVSVAAAAPVPNRSTDAVAPAGSTYYAVARPVCAAPKSPDLVRCLAVRRVDVAKGTPGAVRYVRSAGISRGPAHGYTPADLAAAYHYNPRVNRRNQTVAVVDWHDNPYALRDLNAFDKHYGFAAETSRSFRKVNQKGRTSPLPATDRDAATEISLDVQAVRSVCRTCRILLVEATRGSLANLAAAENTAARLGATEISNSYGMPEPSHISASIVAAYRHPGVAITVSTGDDGWYGWDWMNDHVRSDGKASFPSTSPNVVAVGGTSLVLGSNAARTNEYVWNNNGADDSRGYPAGRGRGASGGGCSTLFGAPAWQSAYPGYAAAGCHGKRLGTDVSAIADPMYGFDVYDRYGVGGWLTVGGTSLSSPIVAAMYALAGGAGGSSYPAASLYTNGSYRASSIYDVTAGGTGFCAGDDGYLPGTEVQTCQQAAASISRGRTNNPNTIGAGLVDCSYPRTGTKVAAAKLSSQCNATPGYDGASGLGSPRSISLFASTAAAMVIAHSSGPKARKSVGLAVRVRERVPGTRAVSYTWSFGDGRTHTGSAAKLRHTYRGAGTYRVTVSMTDSRHQRAVTHLSLRVR